MQEIWKDIPNYEGLYQASSLGRIKSLNYNHTKKEKTLKPKISSRDNYARVELWKNGKHKTCLVHRLIASTFLENYFDANITVNHKDGNKLNNNINNLEWITLKENIQHGFYTGLYSYQKKIKLINKNNNYDRTFRSMAEASKIMNRNHGYISGKIKKGIFEDENFKWKIV